ncbi:MAG: methionine--tRNA ligase [Tissierellia bacterium]|nr:methionine--tRNA ligase [Tissierellia bacterium]
MEKKTFYITTPIYYPNNNLHLGHTYTTIAADCLKRFKKLLGYDAYLVTGTDEHGQKLQNAANDAGMEPLEYIDGIVDSAKQLWNMLQIDYDVFQRSTDPVHEKMVQEIFKTLYDKGEIYKDTYKGHYCTPCESFWTDSQLNEGNCPDCGREVEYREEESYFFRLSAYRDKLLAYYDENPDFIKPNSRKNEMVNNFLKDGLDDLSVSRTNFDWGIKVPFDEKHVIYVWIDALTCYLSALGYLSEDDSRYQKYWPANVHLMAKEIVRFHVVIWPALLMALDLPLPKQVFAHGWILFDQDKMSKSKGNVVYAEPLIERYGVDALKYFVLREFTFGMDGNFTKEKFIQRLNSDLANDLGNLVSRTITMVEKYFGGIIPEPQLMEPVDEELKGIAVGVAQKVEDCMEELDYSGALEEIWTLVRRTNKYIDETAPWKLGKEENTQRLTTVLYNLSESIRVIAQLIEPFMGETSRRIGEQLGIQNAGWESTKVFGQIPAGTKVVRGDNLFQRLDVEKEVEILDKVMKDLIQQREREKEAAGKAPEKEGKPEVTIDDFSKLQFQVAEILECSPHPKADKLLVFQVKIGEEIRQIVSGIKKWYGPEDLIGKKVIAITNLKPVVLRGVESNGMILAAESGEDLTLLTVLEDIESGADIS